MKYCLLTVGNKDYPFEKFLETKHCIVEEGEGAHMHATSSEGKEGKGQFSDEIRQGRTGAKKLNFQQNQN